jgi:hypothetical protein
MVAHPAPAPRAGMVSGLEGDELRAMLIEHSDTSAKPLRPLGLLAFATAV